MELGGSLSPQDPSKCFSNDKISSYMFLLVGFICFDLISDFVLSWGWQELLTPYYFVSRAK